MQLSTSDWIAIVVGAIQLLASVLVAVWTVRASQPKTSNPQSLSLPKTFRSFLGSWLKASWLFLVFFFAALYGAWALASGDEPLSKAFVVKFTLLIVYAALNAVAAVGFFAIDFLFLLNVKLTEVVQSINRAQGTLAKVQGNSLVAINTLNEQVKRTLPKR